MPPMTLTGLYRYPVKSLRGAAFDALDVGRRGPLHDREWMVVDAKGRFLTQRQEPRMALIGTGLDDDGRLTLDAPGTASIEVGDDRDETVEVSIWRDTVQANPVDAAADDWLSAFLGRRCRLVRFPTGQVRPVDPAYATPGDEVGFADGFPFLLISQASLDALNGRLETPIPMRRFRPNLVIDGCDPHAEDGWRRLRIGELSFSVAKSCTRCIIPTIDPATAQKGREPLRTLSTYRKKDNQIHFGQNLVHDRPGRLALGMSVEVLA